MSLYLIFLRGHSKMKLVTQIKQVSYIAQTTHSSEAFSTLCVYRYNPHIISHMETMRGHLRTNPIGQRHCFSGAVLQSQLAVKCLIVPTWNVCGYRILTDRHLTQHLRKTTY